MRAVGRVYMQQGWSHVQPRGASAYAAHSLWSTSCSLALCIKYQSRLAWRACVAVALASVNTNSSQLKVICLYSTMGHDQAAQAELRTTGALDASHVLTGGFDLFR